MRSSNWRKSDSSASAGMMGSPTWRTVYDEYSGRVEKQLDAQLETVASGSTVGWEMSTMRGRKCAPSVSSLLGGLGGRRPRLGGAGAWSVGCTERPYSAREASTTGQGLRDARGEDDAGSGARDGRRRGGYMGWAPLGALRGGCAGKGGAVCAMKRCGE